MKSPKEKIAVGVLLLGATVGMTGCVPKDHHMYTAYGVVSPVRSILREQAENAAKDNDNDATDAEVSNDDAGAANDEKTSDS